MNKKRKQFVAAILLAVFGGTMVLSGIATLCWYVIAK